MQLELMWHCGAHHGCERYRGDLLTHSAVEFSRHIQGVPVDGLTPAACALLQRTAAGCTGTDLLVRRYALAWLAFSDLKDRSGPAITITIQRSDRDAH